MHDRLRSFGGSANADESPSAKGGPPPTPPLIVFRVTPTAGGKVSNDTIVGKAANKFLLLFQGKYKVADVLYL